MPNVCHVICDTWHVQNPWIFICQPFKPAKLKQLKPSDSTDALLLQYWTASNYTVNYLDPDNIALVPALVWTRDNQMNVFRLCVDVITNWSWSSVPPLHPAWISIQYSTWYTRKSHFIRIYCITDLLKIRNTIFDSLLRMRQHGHTLPAAEEGDLKLWSWPPPVSDRRPWYLAAAHCCYYLLPHRNTQSPANDRFGNFSERSQVGHGCCHVTC